MNGWTVSQMAMTTLKPKTTAKFHLSGQASSAKPRTSPGSLVDPLDGTPKHRGQRCPALKYESRAC